MPLYNYSKLRNRDKKIYSVAGTQISSTGISVSFLRVVAPCTAFTIFLGVIGCIITGHNYFNILGSYFWLNYVLFFTCSGLAAGLAGWYVKVQSYRLYEYLIAYLKPKYVYHTENSPFKRVKYRNYKINGIIYGDL